MPKKTKKQERDERILKHGLALKRIFPATADIGPVTLVEELQALEREAHRSAERECNDPNYTPEQIRRKEASIVKRLEALLGIEASGVPVFLNSDPRGYALKIKDGYVREHKLDIDRDWGGYGILAPEF